MNLERSTDPRYFTSTTAGHGLRQSGRVQTGGELVKAPTHKLQPSQRCPHEEKSRLTDRRHTYDCGCAIPRDAASGWVMIKWVLGLDQELAKAVHAAKLLLSEA